MTIKLNTISRDLNQLTTTARPLSVPLSTVKTRNVQTFFTASDFYLTAIMAQDVQVAGKVYKRIVTVLLTGF